MRWLPAAGLVLALGACRGARTDELAACKAAEARIVLDVQAAPAAVLACSRAYQRTGSTEALFSASRARLMAHDWAAVIESARHAPPEVAGRLAMHAGEAEMALGDRDAARDWYGRALEDQRRRDPLRAANTAARIADLESGRNAFDEAIHFQHESRVLATEAGDGALSALMTVALTQLLLDVGDVRAASATLAGMTDQVHASSDFYNEYLATAGELDAADGRPAAAEASFALCAHHPKPLGNGGTQWRCHVGLAALAIAAGGARDDEARRELDDAAGYEAAVAQIYGEEPDRAAHITWLRALMGLRGTPAEADLALASLEALADAPLGAGTRSRLFTTIGQVRAARGEPDVAESWFIQAATAVEQLRDGAQRGELRRGLPRELRAPYEALFALRVATGNPTGALAAMDSALERDFIDQLAASITGDSDASADHGDDTRIAQAQRRVQALRHLLDRPRAAFEPSSAGSPDVIAFFAAEGTLWRTRVVAGQVRIDRVAPLATLAPLVRAVRADPADLAAGHELRQYLLPPPLLPSGDRTLAIVPDPFLEGVRFAALDGPGGYLIQHNPIVLAPTFALAAGAGIAAAPPTGPPMVLGDPVAVDDRQLPAARAEAVAVAALLGVEPVLGRAADRRAITLARRAKVLHVASHGSARDDGTVIYLADGDFGTADVLELDLAPELVVVASCTSAATRRDAMWTSIAAAFLVTGSRAVVGATGSIPDAVAHDVVVELHRRAVTEGPALALAHALRGAISRGTPVSAWSAFAVLGH